MAKNKTQDLDLSLAMSIYNEEESLELTVEELMTALQNIGISFELYLVNNGSGDRSQEIIDQLRKKYNGYIKVVKIEKNLGLGGAVNKVMKENLKGQIIGFTCADGEVSAPDTAMLVQNIVQHEQVSLIKTIRLHRTDGFRLYISKGYNLLIRILFGIKTNDINGWPVLMRYDAYTQMRLMDYSWIFQLEYLYQIKKNGQNFMELEVEHQRRKGGVSKIKGYNVMQFFFQILSYRWRSMFMRKPAPTPDHQHQF